MFYLDFFPELLLRYWLIDIYLTVSTGTLRQPGRNVFSTELLGAWIRVPHPRNISCHYKSSIQLVSATLCTASQEEMKQWIRIENEEKMMNLQRKRDIQYIHPLYSSTLNYTANHRPPRPGVPPHRQSSGRGQS